MSKYPLIKYYMIRLKPSQ